MTDRAEMSFYKSETETSEGFLIYHDTRWNTPIKGLTTDFRFTWFNIPEYNNRIYTYEYSTPFSYSVPAYYGVGQKWYVMLRYNIFHFLTIYIKYSEMTFSDRNEISTGNELIKGNRKSDINLQLQLKF